MHNSILPNIGNSPGLYLNLSHGFKGGSCYCYNANKCKTKSKQWNSTHDIDSIVVLMDIIKARFKDAFAKWVIDEGLPLSIGESESLKGMI